MKSESPARRAQDRALDYDDRGDKCSIGIVGRSARRAARRAAGSEAQGEHKTKILRAARAAVAGIVLDKANMWRIHL
jgi:hypothetical protein